ncbi:ribonucleoside diphosphate reductase beta chain [Erwinia phage phiEa104]|uniref:ribonucleoside-diphosphate reductase n=6 Tax=Caudoviricetes TaxID=2731619 RepID=B8QU02_9CAUD|nr:putative ribonucleoside diphosphate reductase beta chain [Erwinia phage phiEa21-4]YP_004327080.1 ribonucleoside diphosphate reductase beta chain [Erwinia phage phiEa104]AXN57428.1 putative ribonucleoside triphosphate reductase [Erwinia phage SunLIRen]AYD79535.1 ribonucleoside-diphosphate reductase 1 subunit beta [Enterobacter phage phi63_307]UFD98368.1 ribonucleoside-diphosphate reductase 1 subunit [Hafnia phage vB_HalM_SPARTY]UXD79789.1 putative ribonucleoside diphosphate reductase beta ch
MSSTVFNHKNDAYLTASYPLFMGQPLAMYDSMNKIYPELFDLYKQQKAQDWSEDEVNLENSRIDFQTAAKSEIEVCIENLLWQWEADSRVSRNIITLLAPFISNNEFAAMVTKQTEIENLHALTYSEIVRQCISDPTEMIKRVMDNQAVLDRSSTIDDVMAELEILGAKKRLGYELDDEHIRQTLIKFMVSILALEGLEFIASFACTFALAQRGLFMGVAQLVQKIMLDEILHSKMDFAALDILLKDPVWFQSYQNCKGDVQRILDEVMENESNWADYIFSEGRSVVGLNPTLLKEWVYYSAKPLYDFLNLDYNYPVVVKNPLPYMDKWMNIDSQQNANQEQDNSQYLLNTMVNDDEDGKGLGAY